jgi:hypothetical protein
MFIEVPSTQNNHHSAHILFFTYGIIFKILLDSVEGTLFVQKPRTEEQTGNVTNAQNGCARTIVTVARNNYTRDKYNSRLCSEPYFIFLKYFIYFTVYNSIKIKNLNKSNVVSSFESVYRTLKKQCWENNFKKSMGTKCTQFSKSRKFFAP